MQRITSPPTPVPIARMLAQGMRYALRGQALATCIVLTFAYLPTALPGALGMLAKLLYWSLAWRYAATCLVQTAHGYTRPPEGVDGQRASIGLRITLIQVLVASTCSVSIVYDIRWLWPIMLVSVMALPAIHASLAFDGDLGIALNPVRWPRTAMGFGGVYLVPVALNVIVFLLDAGALRHLVPAFAALLLSGFAGCCLAILNFYLIGAILYQHHERFGIEPESHSLMEATGQETDERLVEDLRAMVLVDPRAALDMFSARLQSRSAPAAIHRAYRELLGQQGMREGLLHHGQIWGAALVANGEMQRALGLVHECIELDAAFVPNDPTTTGPLAEQAIRMGMPKLALHLLHGFLRHWPRSPDAPRYGLLAARLIAEHPSRRTEARVLLVKLADTWPDHPLLEEIEALHHRLTS